MDKDTVRKVVNTFLKVEEKRQTNLHIATLAQEKSTKDILLYKAGDISKLLLGNCPTNYILFFGGSVATIAHDFEIGNFVNEQKETQLDASNPLKSNHISVAKSVTCMIFCNRSGLQA